MRVPLDWLRDYVDLDLAPEALAERLTLLGFEVKGLDRWGSEWRNVVVGELLTVEKHPRADRLSLTTVRVGSGEPLQIVCGATNIAPGQRVPVALPGAVLPGNRAIERTEKMGVVSNGMLCSGDELRLSVDGEGILILPGGTPLGAALTDLYGDWVLDVDVKPNRGDALCLVGLAREVAAATGLASRFPEVGPLEDGPPAGGPPPGQRRGRRPLPAVRGASRPAASGLPRRRETSSGASSRRGCDRSATSSTPRTTSCWSLASRRTPSMPTRWRATRPAGPASWSGRPARANTSRRSTTWNGR